MQPDRIAYVLSEVREMAARLTLLSAHLEDLIAEERIFAAPGVPEALDEALRGEREG